MKNLSLSTLALVISCFMLSAQTADFKRESIKGSIQNGFLVHSKGHHKTYPALYLNQQLARNKAQTASLQLIRTVFSAPDTLGQFKDFFKHEYTYNTNGQTTEWAEFEWYNGAWSPTIKRTYHYNSSQLLEEYFEWQINFSTMQLELLGKSVFTYKPNNQIDEVKFYSFTNGVYTQNGRGSYSYHINGEINLILFEHLNNGNWINGEEIKNLYNSSNELVLNTQSYNWNQTTNMWDAIISTDYTYNTNGQLVDFSSTEMYNLAVTWGKRYSYAYDVNNNHTNPITGDDYNAGNWIPAEEIINYPRLSVKHDDVIWPVGYFGYDFFYDMEHNYNALDQNYNALDSLAFYDISGGSPQKYLVARLEYNQFIDIQENQNIEAVIYPNPAKTHFRIKAEDKNKIERIQIISLDGRVCSEIINPQREIDVSDLESGVYIVEMRTGTGEHIVKRLVKM